MSADIRNKTLILEFTMDIDPDTLSDDTVDIFERATRNNPEYTLELIPKGIIVTFQDWPVPNSEYILRIQNLKSVTGLDLSAGIKRPFAFVSNVLSTVEITYPAFDEQIKDLKMEWIEKAVDNNPVNSYYIEISTENAFHNMVLKTSVLNRQFIDLKELTDGQYYARVRAQLDDGTYGYWSNLVTFIVAETEVIPGPIYEDSIFADDLNIVSVPEDGKTPTSFIIEFDGEIDVNSVANIIVMRRDI